MAGERVLNKARENAARFVSISFGGSSCDDKVLRVVEEGGRLSDDDEDAIATIGDCDTNGFEGVGCIFFSSVSAILFIFSLRWVQLFK